MRNNRKRIEQRTGAAVYDRVADSLANESYPSFDKRKNDHLDFFSMRLMKMKRDIATAVMMSVAKPKPMRRK